MIDFPCPSRCNKGLKPLVPHDLPTKPLVPHDLPTKPLVPHDLPTVESGFQAIRRQALGFLFLLVFLKVLFIAEESLDDFVGTLVRNAQRRLQLVQVVFF